MGDHRADIEIKFRIHGKLYQQKWCINYWPDLVTGVDYRVADWFNSCWRDALARYETEIAEANAEADARRLEQSERAELARLKEKYDVA